MEDNDPTLRTDINQLKRTQRLGQRKVSVTSIIRKGFASPFQPLHTGMQAPPIWPHSNFQNFQVGSWPKHTWLLPPSTLRRAYSAHQQITATTKPSSAMELYIFGACCVILEYIAGTTTVVTRSVYLQNQVDRQFQHFFSRLSMFSELLNPDVWALLALVANPTINK